MGVMASQITNLAIVYSTVYSDVDQRKHQSSASLAFVWGFHRWPVNSPQKWPVTQKMFPFDDVIMRHIDAQFRGRINSSPLKFIQIALITVPSHGYYGVSNHRQLPCLFNRLYRRTSKERSKLRVTGFCEGNPPVTDGFPSQRASNKENVSIWWRHHVYVCV